MLIVGDNLKSLCVQFKIVDDLSSYDVNSLTLHLHESIKEFDVPNNTAVTYGEEIKPEWVNDSNIGVEGYVLKRNTGILACSRERISIPLGYFGYLQTKGSLARYFVSVACNDGQIEPGFNGRITFEIANMGPMQVKLRKADAVGQLFIFRTSTNNAECYNGRYQNADGPTAFVTAKSS